jgi:hypothetical protein
MSACDTSPHDTSGLFPGFQVTTTTQRGKFSITTDRIFGGFFDK